MKTIDQAREALRQRVPAAEIRRSPSGHDYIDGHYVIATLNEAFDIDGWSHYVVRGPEQVRQHIRKARRKGSGEDGTPTMGENEVVVVQAVVRLVVRLLSGSGVVRLVHEDVGIGSADGPVGAESYGALVDKAHKESVTDALKRCARHLGDALGLELYERDNPNAERAIRQRQAEERAEAQRAAQAARQAAATATAPSATGSQAGAPAAPATPPTTTVPARPRVEESAPWQQALRQLDGATQATVLQVAARIRAVPTTNGADAAKAMLTPIWHDAIKGLPQTPREMLKDVWWEQGEAAGMERPKTAAA